MTRRVMSFNFRLLFVRRKQADMVCAVRGSVSNELESDANGYKPHAPPGALSKTLGVCSAMACTPPQVHARVRTREHSQAHTRSHADGHMNDFRDET
eukprot:859474-Pleurochrysis_carterae.AAC.2